MKEKLTKEELLEQLAEIKKQEREIVDEILYNTYKDLTFLQIWKKSINWKTLLFLTYVLEIPCLFDTKNMILLIGFIPPLMLLLSLSISYEVYQKFKYIKKKKENI